MWTAAGWCERDCISSSPRLVIMGPRQRQHRGRLHRLTEIHYVSVRVQKEKVKSSHRTRSCSQKEIRTVTICSLNNAHSFWPGAPGQISSEVVGEPCIDPTFTLAHIKLLSLSFFRGEVCWETVLHRSLMFLRILPAEVLTAFVLDYFFKDVCIIKSSGGKMHMKKNIWVP